MARKSENVPLLSLTSPGFAHRFSHCAQLTEHLEEAIMYCTRPARHKQ